MLLCIQYTTSPIEGTTHTNSNGNTNTNNADTDGQTDTQDGQTGDDSDAETETDREISLIECFLINGGADRLALGLGSGTGKGSDGDDMVTNLSNSSLDTTQPTNTPNTSNTTYLLHVTIETVIDCVWGLLSIGMVCSSQQCTYGQISIQNVFKCNHNRFVFNEY